MIFLSRTISRPIRLAVLAALSGTSLGIAAHGQVVYTATSLTGGEWNDPAIWSVVDGVTPVVGVYPDNAPGGVGPNYDVLTPGSPSFNVVSDIHINSIDNTSGFDITLNGNIFTIENAVSSTGSSGAAVTVHGGTLRLNGDSVFDSRFSLLDGAVLENNGILETNPSASNVDFADTTTLTGGAKVVNNGTINANRSSGTTDGLTLVNNGEWNLSAGVTLQAETFDQPALVAVPFGDKVKTTLREGGVLSAKNLKIDGGQVLVLGNAKMIGTESYRFNGGGVIIGQGATGPCKLTLNGIPAKNAGKAGSFTFLIKGAGDGQYSTLFVENGGAGDLFDGLTLSLDVQGYTIKSGDTFNLITGGNLGPASFKNAFAGNTKINFDGLGTFNLIADSTHVSLGGFTPVPEPDEIAAVSAMVLVGFGLGRGFRRRS